MFVVEAWDAQHASWIAVSTHATKHEARTRLWELRIPHGRVREVAR